MKKHISFSIGALILLLANIPAVARTYMIQHVGTAGPTKSAEEACQTAREHAHSDLKQICSEEDSKGKVMSEHYFDKLSGNTRVGFQCSSRAYGICNVPYSPIGPNGPSS
jgi:hypothetical protein